MDLTKLIMNPARWRIMEYMMSHARVHISEILEYMDDIPRATVYHHIKILEENGIAKVVEENKVRGTVEKIYSMKTMDDMALGGGLAGVSAAFHMGLLQEMNQYFGQSGMEYQKDMVFFTKTMLYMTDEEYAELIDDILKLTIPFTERRGQEGLRIRNLSLISSPPKEYGAGSPGEKK